MAVGTGLFLRQQMGIVCPSHSDHSTRDGGRTGQVEETGGWGGGNLLIPQTLLGVPDSYGALHPAGF